ncbi:hypothetical protein C6P46_003580 [Rhodotorula mucilaginosa]|uniref:Uncharacterized protein n=1 Tax=Rhodotorula mucilaginosa TaxID=5537 RepID=A0A9P6WA22_RHOMI|nr:hypothetical protein C6P46_003580 [Rhodotorula mucilaginosa]
MLKRISNSFTKDSTGRPTNDLTSALLIPPPSSSSPLLLPPLGARPPGYSSPRSSPSPAASPTRRGGGGSSFPFPTTLQQQPPQTRPGSRQGTREETNTSSLIDRTVLHKTLTNLSTLLVALDELRDASQTQSRARKRVAKASRDLAAGFSTPSTKGGVGAEGECREVDDAFKSCAMMMDALYEVEERHAKALRKEYEALNEAVARYFRRTAKEEKAHEDQLADLDERVAKATAAYHSNARSSAASSQHNLHVALDSMTTQHSMYMNQLSTLSAGINAAKVQYSHEIATRRRIAGAEFAYSLCTLTEREWRKHVEAVKKGADSIGRVVAAAAWVQPGMENVSALASDPPLDAKTAPDLPEQRYPSEGMNEISTLGSSRFASGSGHGPPSSSLSSRAASSLGPAHDSPLRPPPRSFAHETSFASQTSLSEPLKSPYDGSEAFVRTVDRDIGNDASPTRTVEGYQHDHPSGEILSPTMSSSWEHPNRATGTAAPQNKPTLNRSPAPTSPFSSSPQHSFFEEPFSRRQDSIVARLSRKYSENESIAEIAPKPPPPQPESWHKGSDSRVSQLAKRYSSPPAPLSPALAPQPETQPSFAPPYANSQDTAARGTPSPGPQRYRAYQAAQPLPPPSPSLPFNRGSYTG